MTSFFPFSSSSTSLASSTSTLVNDDPHLQVTVTPSASAFYAGESFSVTITFKNTRNAPPAAAVPSTPATAPTAGEIVSAFRPPPPTVDRHGSPPSLPVRAHRMGQATSVKPRNDINGSNAEAGPSRTPEMADLASPIGQDLPRDYPYSPGANPAYRAPGWPSRDDGATIRSPEAWRRREYGDIGKGHGHGRRTRSLAIGKAVSPQEMVWALEGHSAPTPPPLPSRRPQGAPIPTHHPHSRKESIAAALLSPPAMTAQLPTSSSDLPSIPELGLQPSRGTSRSTSRPSSRNTSSAASSRSRVDLTDNESRTSSDITASHPRRPGASPTNNHSRTPSYANAYGASLMGVLAQPPPLHPYIRSQEPRGTTTILWAYTRLVAHFHPSNTHIPPDPLLPLRSMLLHQPVGSGSLMPGSSIDAASGTKPSSSRWEFSFGTGTIGNATQPSLTGSLFGLAKGLVAGGSGGTLEEERKRVWNMKDLPVLETTRSLLGVDVKLKEGEERAFTYTLPIPTNLPPAYSGKAFRFSYDLVLTVNVALPGKGNRQRNKEIQVPIRIWANVSLSQPNRTYDVLKPVIQTRDEGIVDETRESNETKVTSLERARSKAGDTQKSLEVYAKHLLGAADPASPPRQGKLRVPPLSPSRVHPRGRIISPSSPLLDLPDTKPNGDTLPIPGTIRKTRLRQGSFIEGDDELVEENGEGGCGEAVEVLSRHSPKTSFDIAKDGHPVAVLTLIKSTYRLGESVLGVVSFNQPGVERRVLKFCAFLESHEIIPENLLPPSTGPTRQPPIHRLHAEHASAYALHSSRLAFSLDIPSDATPSFALAAGPDGYPGGLEWRVRLSLLISVPRKHSRGPGHSLVGVSASHADNDNKLYAATTSLAPVHRNPEAKDGDEALVVGKTEVMDVEIPVKVLAGNTAFLVKPSVHVV